VQSLVRSLRHRSCVVVLAGLAACFVEPPPVVSDTDTGDPCALDRTACTCMSNGCEDSTSASGSTNADTGESTSAAADESTDSAPVTDSSGEDGDSSSDGSASGTSSGSPDDTGSEEMCGALACAQCVACVDGEGQACAAAYAACDAVNGCATAVSCLVNCGLGIDCLDNCCMGLDAEQLEVVNDLVLCKSDECIETCEMQAEFDAC